MANLLQHPIDCDDGDRAAKLIRDALGIADDAGYRLRQLAGCVPLDGHKRPEMTA
jgi:uncharacterized protein HemY